MIDVLFTTVTPVAAVPPRLTVAPARKPVPAMVTAVPPLAVPELGVMAVTVGAGLPEPPCPLPRNVAICITQLPELFGAVALLLPLLLTVLSSARLPKLLMIRLVNPAPAPVNATPVVLPADLADERAWVWADLLTGTLWYYDNKPAFKIQFTNPETRARIFKFVFDRGDRQYIIQDNDRMLQFMDEIIKGGGTLELRGKVDGQRYFLIHWPQGGPLSKNVARTSR